VALFNETLAGRFNEMIRRLHQMKSTPAPQIAPEIGHEIVLESDRPEWLVLQGGFPWAMRQVVAAAVGNFSHAGIRNPTGSGLLVVVTNIEISNSGGVSQQYNLKTRPQAAINSTSTSFFRDSRRGFGGGCPVLVLGDNTGVSSLGNGPLEQISVLAGQGTDFFVSAPYILSPGFELLVVPSAVNQLIDASFAGYARQVSPEELNIL
jgi:hypothetical protein